MSTRANIIICDESTTLIFYRHSDGYPDVCGKRLIDFVKGYDEHMRMDAMQSAGWLVIAGWKEYGANEMGQGKYDTWKVGAYEPTENIHGDVEYVYIIDLKAGTLSCRVPNGDKDFWDKPTLKATKACKEFKTVKFGGAK